MMEFNWYEWIIWFISFFSSIGVFIYFAIDCFKDETTLKKTEEDTEKVV